MLFIHKSEIERLHNADVRLSIEGDECIDRKLEYLHGQTPSSEGYDLNLTARIHLDASRLEELIQAINKVGQLKSLTYRCEVTGQFSLFTNALIQAGDHLKWVHVYTGNGGGREDDTMCPTSENLVAFGNALAQLPCLEVLGVPFFKPFPELTAWEIALPAMSRPNNLLRHVVIEDSPPTSKQGKEELRNFLEACKNCPHLEKLEICNGHKTNDGACVKGEDLPLVVQLLEVLPNLTSLALSCDSSRVGLIEALKTNQKLEELTIGCGPPIFVHGGLGRDDEFRLYPFHLHEAKTFHSLLRSFNFTLTSDDLTIYPWNSSHSCSPRLSNPALSEEWRSELAAIRFFLRLNFYGRKAVMGPGNTAGKGDWIKAIADKTDDFSAVFYYLQQNPSLCNGNTGLHHLPGTEDLQTQTFRYISKSVSEQKAQDYEDNDDDGEIEEDDDSSAGDESNRSPSPIYSRSRSRSPRGDRDGPLYSRSRSRSQRGNQEAGLQGRGPWPRDFLLRWEPPFPDRSGPSRDEFGRYFPARDGYGGGQERGQGPPAFGGPYYRDGDRFGGHGGPPNHQYGLPHGGRGGGGGRRMGAHEGRVSLMVRNLEPTVSIQELTNVFSWIGHIRDVYIPRDCHSQQPKGYGFLEYETPDMAMQARNEMNGFVLRGRELEVVFARGRRKTPNEMRGRVV